MNEILCILFPSALGTLIYKKNTQIDTSKTIFIYMINVMVNNIISYAYLYNIENIKNINYNNVFVMKYILYSCILSIFTGLIMTIISKKISLKVEVIKIEKRNKKRNDENRKRNQDKLKELRKKQEETE